MALHDYDLSIAIAGIAMCGPGFDRAAGYWDQTLNPEAAGAETAYTTPHRDAIAGRLIAEAATDARWTADAGLHAFIACGGAVLEGTAGDFGELTVRAEDGRIAAFEGLGAAVFSLQTGRTRAVVAGCVDPATGSGVALALKRQSDAERDGDSIYATLVSEEDHSPCAVAEVCLMPNGEMDEDAWEVLRAKLTDPERIVPHTRLAIESCDSDGQAMKSLVKIALALHTKIIPPGSGGGERLAKGFYGTAEPLPWVHGDRRQARTGAVVECGRGEVRIAAALREYKGDNPWAHGGFDVRKGYELLLTAAPDREELLKKIGRLLAEIEAAADEPVEALCRREREGGLSGDFRLAVVARDGRDLAAKLRAALEKIAQSRRRPQIADDVFYCEPGDAGGPGGKMAFLFPGFNSEYPRMFQDLCLHYPEVREWFDCMDLFAGVRHGLRPSDLVFPPPSGMEPELREELEKELKLGGPSSLVACLAMCELLRRSGVEPDVLAGHSNGENAALVSARVLDCPTKEAVFRMINEVTVHLRQAGSGPEMEGRFLAVSGVGAEQVKSIVEASAGRAFLAMDNCASQVVLYAATDEAEVVRRRVLEAGGLCFVLVAERPYHTPLFAEQAEGLRRIYSGIPVGREEIPVYSTASTERLPVEAEQIRSVALSQWTQPVLFQDTIRRLYEDGVRIFVEVGPDATLTGFVTEILRRRKHLAVASNSRNRAGLQQFQRLRGLLFVLGRVQAGAKAEAQEKPAAMAEAQVPAAAALPMRAAARGDAAIRSRALQLHFELMNEFLESHERVFAVVAARLGNAGTANAGSVQMGAERAAGAVGREAQRVLPMLGEVVERDGRRLYAERLVTIERDTFLLNHMLGRSISRRQPELHGLPIVPFTMTMEIIAEAALSLCGGLRVLSLTDMRGYRWLAADRGALRIGIDAELISSGMDGSSVRVRVYELDEARERSLAFEGVVHLAAEYAAAPAPLDIRLQDGRAPVITPEYFFEEGTYNGRVFRGIERVHEVDGTSIVAELAVPPVDGFLRDVPAPGFEVAGPLLDSTGQLAGYWLAEMLRRDFGIFPFQVQGYSQYGPAPGPGARLTCRATMGFNGVVVNCTFDFIDASGAVWARMTGMQLRVFNTGWVKRFFTAHREGEYFSEAWEMAGAEGHVVRRIDTLERDFLEQSWGIWSRALAHLILNRNELDYWYSLPAKTHRRTDWLLGRLTAKDAVRIWARERFDMDLDPPDIEVLPDENGAPVVRCAPLSMRGMVPSVSITHSEGAAAAAVLESGAEVGIDFEAGRSGQRLAWLETAFAASERRFLNGDNAELLALWCAKEAAAKACGKGLGGRPDRWVIEEMAEDRRWCRVRHEDDSFDVCLHRGAGESAAICCRWRCGDEGGDLEEEELHAAYENAD